MTHLVQFLLPLFDNENQPFPRSAFDEVFHELAETFGGVTAYQRSPAEGAWVANDGEVNRDQVISFEVMVKELDRAWWAGYRQELEQRFRQEELLIRATAVEKL
jgi:hypothetical protein